MKKVKTQCLIQSFLKEKSFLKHETIKHYETSLRRIESFFKMYKIVYITDFKREHSIDFVNYLKTKNSNNITIRQRLKVLKSLLKYALELGFINKLDFAKVALKDNLEELEKKELRTFDLKEIEMLIKNAKGELKSYLMIAFFTGARTGELLGLKKGDIDFLDKKIAIKRSLSQRNILDTPKNQSSFRKMDMLPIIETELKKICKNKKDDDFLFVTKRIKLANEFKKLQKNLNICHLRRLYDTRHSFASVMLSKGEEAMWVSRVMLGHSDLNTTFKYYAKYLPKNVTNRALFLNELELA